MKLEFIPHIEKYLTNRKQDTFVFKMSYIFDSSMKKSTEYRRLATRWINSEIEKHQLVIGGYQITKTPNKLLYRATSTRILSGEEIIFLTSTYLKCEKHELVDKVRELTTHIQDHRSEIKHLKKEISSKRSMITSMCGRCESLTGERCYNYKCPLWSASPYSLPNVENENNV